MEGTPLNETIVATRTIVKKFREDTGVDILNVVFLTDGEGTTGIYAMDSKGNRSSRNRYVRGNKLIIYDPIARKEYLGGASSNLFYSLKDSMKVNVIGFYLLGSINDEYSISRSISNWVSDSEKQKKSMAEYKKFNCCNIPRVGYDSFFLIPDLDQTEEKFGIHMDPGRDHTVDEITDEFKKHSFEKIRRKVILSRFIQLIKG